MYFPITFKDFIDILLVTVILYGVYRILRKNGAVNLFIGILFFILVWFTASHIFHLELTGALFNRIIEVGVIALIIIFQNEIRAFAYQIGSQFTLKQWHIRKYSRQQEHVIHGYINQILLACQHLSETKTGALIVLNQDKELQEYADTGERLDAAISARMIENIFFKNTPLHDGALLIQEWRLDSAACILPVSQNQTLPQHYGFRHRAAVGLTERTNTLAIVVSEETGEISLAEGNRIDTVSVNELHARIIRTFKLSEEPAQ